jgi:hypothetical protein
LKELFIFSLKIKGKMKADQGNNYLMLKAMGNLAFVTRILQVYIDAVAFGVGKMIENQ